MAADVFPEAVAPTTEDSLVARETSRVLAKFVGRPRQVKVEVQADGERPEVESAVIPEVAFRLLLDILKEMAQGNAVTIIPVHAELTTQQAAEILNVSRPFVIKLIEDKILPCTMVGTHRRVRYSDLRDYKQRVDAKRLETLDELAAQAQELGMGY